MKKANARDIFPPALLRQIQKYVSGQTIYIPATDQKRAWGETSGYKRYIQQRNQEMKRRFHQGESMECLAAEYALSAESVKRIVYSKKECVFLDYHCSFTSAMQFAKQGKLEEWVHRYLLSDGHNREFSDGLKLYDRYFLGPVRMPLQLFSRCCGPEEQMKYRVDAAWFEKQVAHLQQVIASGADMPPLIVHYTAGMFELNDGNHRHEAYRRLGITHYPVIIWITETEEKEDFLEKYGEYLQK